MEKELIRAHVRAQGTVDPGVDLLVVSGLFAWLSKRLPGTASAFLGMKGEVDLRPLFDRLPGWRWVLPRVEPKRVLSFRDRDVPREVHVFGMEQPADEGIDVPVHEIDVFLTPGVAFDLAGGRLGNGGGYYDRVLARRRSDSVAVGVTTETRLLPSVPMHEHDQSVDLVATEKGVRECLPTR